MSRSAIEGFNTALQLFDAGSFQKAHEEFFSIAQVASKDHGTGSKRPREKATDLIELAALADAAMCQVKMLTPSYQVALEYNQQYRDALRRQCWSNQHLQSVAAALLEATVTAAWLYLQMDDVAMARNALQDGIQQALSIVSTRADPCFTNITIYEMMYKLQKLLDDKSALAKFLHAWRVLDLIHMTPRGTNSLFEAARDNSNIDTVGNKDEGTSHLESRNYLLEAIRCHTLLQQSGSNLAILRRQRNELLSRTSPQDPISAKIQMYMKAFDCLEDPFSPTMGDDTAAAVPILRDLATTSQLAEVFNLLGCLESKISLEKALVSFQKALELDPNSTEIVSNTAECLLNVGQPALAKEMLLGMLQSQDEAHQTEPSSSSATCFLLSPIQSTIAKILDSKEVVLWRIYLAASLDSDLATQMAMVDSLSDSFCSCYASAFSLLQANCPKQALAKCEEGTCTISAVACLLVEAESKLLLDDHHNWGLKENDNKPGVRALVTKAKAAYEKDCATRDNAAASREIRVILNNNFGVIHLLEGMAGEAISHLKELMSSIGGTDSKIYLQPHFNLALALWREKRTQEATEVWLTIRSLPSAQRGQRDQVGGAIETVKGALLRNSPSSGLKCDKSPVSRWRVEGLDQNLALVMDILMLECSRATSERTFSHQYDLELFSQLLD